MTGIGVYARVTDSAFSEQVFADLRKIEELSTNNNHEQKNVKGC